MHNKPLWEMTGADFEECEKLIKAKIKDLERFSLEINVHVHNEIWLYIKESRAELNKALNHIKALAKQKG